MPLVELADVEPAEDDDIADEDALPAEELEAIPLDPEAGPDALAVVVGALPPAPPSPPGVVSRSSLPSAQLQVTTPNKAAPRRN